MTSQRWSFLLIGRPLQRHNGQAMLEMLFGFIIFLSFFMAIVEFSHLLYAKVTSQHALRTAGRYMVTGKTGKDALNVDIPRNQMIHDVFCANVIAAGMQCPPLGANFTFVCLPTSPATACTEPGGGPEQTVMVTVVLTKPALMPFFSRFFPSGGVNFQISTTWKNEPFRSS